MVAGGLPTVQVLLDDGTGTFPYDITTKARLKYNVARGRQDEQSQVTPGQLTLTLNNTDGRFTPGSTIIASPSPIVVDQQIRVKVTANAVTVNRFTGYVQSWPVAWPTGGDTLSEVTITATDAQARAERRVLLSLPQEEISLDSPSVYYTMSEAEGASGAGDSSGNQAPALTMAGTGADVVFGQATGAPTDGLTGATFAGGKYLYTDSIPEVPWLVVEFNTSTPSADCLVGMSPDTLLGVKLGIDGSGYLFATAGAVTATYAGAVVTDGLDHVAHAVPTGGFGNGFVDLYLDGVKVATSGLGVVGFLVTPQPFVVGRGFTGSLSHVAGGLGTLTGTRAAAQAAALLTGFAGESGTARITRLAGYAGLPLGTLDPSLTNVAFNGIAGTSASAALQDVAAAEMGLLFVDGSGNTVFHNRNEVVAKTSPDITIDANQLDEGTAFTTDMQGVLNYFETTAAGTSVTQVVRDLTSEDEHGRYPGSATYLVQTDAEALDRANWLVSTHKEPGPRVGTLAISMFDLTAAQQSTLLAAEPDTWVRVTGLPSQAPGGTTVDLVVQGLADALDASSDPPWVLTFNVVSKTAVYPTPWILGNSTYSVLDSTTKLYV